MSSFFRGCANLLCIVPVWVYSAAEVSTQLRILYLAKIFFPFKNEGEINVLLEKQRQQQQQENK